MLWIVTVLVHLLCASYYAACAHLYNVLPSTIAAVNMRAFGLTIDPKHYPVLVALHALCSAFHALLLLEMLLYTLWFRRLLFTHEVFLRKTQRQLRRAASLRSVSRLASISMMAKTWGMRLRALWHRWFGPNGVFGVDQSYFPVLFLVREISEIGLQSYQAYKMSRLVPRKWLNELYVTLITLNCWTTPVLTEVVYRQHHRRRALRMCLLVDVVLDFVATVGIPTILAIPYVQAYDPRTTDFRDEFWNSDAWYVNMVNEFRLVFIQSWTDCAAQFAFSASLLMCLDDLKILASSDGDARSSANGGQGTQSHTSLIVGPPRAKTVPIPTLATAREQRTLAWWETRLSMCGHVAMVLWGIAVAAMHIEAQRDAPTGSCLVHVHPWLSPKTACSLLFIDCLASDSEGGVGSSGSGQELELTWASFNTEMLGLMTIANCPALVVPESMGMFTNLMGLNLLNVTVVEWSDAAALTHTRFPNIRHLGLLFVDFSLSLTDPTSIFPPGLRATDHPRLLRDVFMLECNLGGLPDDLDKTWPPLANVMLPVNGIEAFPPTLLHMTPMRIVLTANAIATVPIDVFALDSLVALELTANPIDALPDAASPLFRVGQALTHVILKDTNIAHLPAWMTTPAFLDQVTVRAANTPLCARLLASDASDVASARLVESIDCTS